MRLFTTIAGLRCYLEHDCSGKDIGFVPTMGALHRGHLSLIERARRQNAIAIVSIFINPLQFGPTEDFERYPQSLAADRLLCQQAGVDAIFAPTVEELYGQAQTSEGLTQVIPPVAMTSVLCGRSRQGHFQGVATIVTKLLNLVQPKRAYFGQKDAQQLAIVKQMVADLNLAVEIVGCPIVREDSGLALSSRNQYLTPLQKAQASVLYRALQQAQQAFEAGECDCKVLIEVVKSELAAVNDIQVEYIELVHPTRLTPLEKIDDSGNLAIAARVGSTRLIDNVMLQHRKAIVAIDGPAGVGKSTVTRKVAKALGLLHLDTGAMYRAVTWQVLQAGIDFDDESAIAELVSQSQICLTTNEECGKPPRVWVDGVDITQAIRSQEVTKNVSAIAAQKSVRQELVKQQQSWGSKGGIVAEGRDIGTHVFPDAELKIFLTASVQERARRRQQDLKEQNLPDLSLEQLERDIKERDRRDSTRAIAPLRKAEDAIELSTDGLSAAQVIEKIINLYHQQVTSAHF
jgi:pantoate ligase/cytidylate kinase